MRDEGEPLYSVLSIKPSCVPFAAVRFVVGSSNAIFHWSAAEIRNESMFRFLEKMSHWRSGMELFVFKKKKIRCETVGDGFETIFGVKNHRQLTILPIDFEILLKHHPPGAQTRSIFQRVCDRVDRTPRTYASIKNCRGLDCSTRTTVWCDDFFYNVGNFFFSTLLPAHFLESKPFTISNVYLPSPTYFFHAICFALKLIQRFDGTTRKQLVVVETCVQQDQTSPFARLLLCT